MDCKCKCGCENKWTPLARFRKLVAEVAVNALAKLADGGSTGQVLTKLSNADYDAGWETLTISWGSVTGKPTTFTPSSHTHPISQITNLQTTLDGKASLSGAVFTGVVKIDQLDLSGLPTSSAGLPSGMLWNNGGTPAIS